MNSVQNIGHGIIILYLLTLRMTLTTGKLGEVGQWKQRLNDVEECEEWEMSNGHYPSFMILVDTSQTMSGLADRFTQHFFTQSYNKRKLQEIFKMTNFEF